MKKRILKSEEKELLIKDLLPRIPTGLFVDVPDEEEPKELEKVVRWKIVYGRARSLEDCLDGLIPYLRPLSSMTVEEKQELERLIDEKLNGNTSQEDDEWTPWVLHDTTGIKNSVGGERFYFDEMSFIYDWLNKKMFAYRAIDGKDMFELGLALEAPEGMYN